MTKHKQINKQKDGKIKTIYHKTFFCSKLNCWAIGLDKNRTYIIIVYNCCSVVKGLNRKLVTPITE